MRHDLLPAVVNPRSEYGLIDQHTPDSDITPNWFNYQSSRAAHDVITNNDVWYKFITSNFGPLLISGSFKLAGHVTFSELPSVHWDNLYHANSRSRRCTNPAPIPATSPAPTPPTIVEELIPAAIIEDPIPTPTPVSTASIEELGLATVIEVPVPTATSEDPAPTAIICEKNVPRTVYTSSVLIPGAIQSNDPVEKIKVCQLNIDHYPILTTFSLISGRCLKVVLPRHPLPMGIRRMVTVRLANLRKPQKKSPKILIRVMPTIGNLTDFATDFQLRISKSASSKRY